MNALRWILGLGIWGVAAVFVQFSLALGRLFGSRTSAVEQLRRMDNLIPLAALGILFAGVLFPGQRILLHLGALAALVLAVLAGMSGINPFTLTAIPYLVLWTIFYWLAAWRGGATVLSAAV